MTTLLKKSLLPSYRIEYLLNVALLCYFLGVLRRHKGDEADE